MRIAALAALCIAFTACAADKDKETFLTPEAGGQDYKDQGEYKNEWGGAQVIALGNERFRMVSFRGGLPGDGWDKEFRQEVNGRRDGGKVVFTSTNGYRAELANGKITIQSEAGGPWTMEKVERRSPTEGARAPSGAIVLFETGKGLDNWRDAHLDDRGLLAAGCKTKQLFTNYTLHCEFLLPFKPTGRAQDRGNSGVYMQDRYEVQVLDSFGLKGEWDECGGVYSQAKPLLNMCYPPLTWQTYDIDFTAAKFDENGKKVKNAVMTAKHNGVVIHDKLELKGPTGGGKRETPAGGAIQLQGHGNPVYYRNVWIVPKP